VQLDLLLCAAKGKHKRFHRPGSPEPGTSRDMFCSNRRKEKDQQGKRKQEEVCVCVCMRERERERERAARKRENGGSRCTELEPG